MLFLLRRAVRKSVKMLWRPSKISRLNWQRVCLASRPRAVGRQAHRNFILLIGAAMPPLLLLFLRSETHAGNLLHAAREQRR